MQCLELRLLLLLKIDEMEQKHEPTIGLNLELRKLVIVTSVLASLVTLAFFIYANLSSNETLAGVQTATTYASITDGEWNKSSTWDNGVPSGSSTDEVIVQHKVILKSNLNIIGKVTIEAAGEIYGNYELKVGYGDNEKGEVYNYGTISVDKLKVKDNGSGPHVLIGLPTVHNFGIVTLSTELWIGTNAGHGSFFNQPGGTVTAPKLHLDNYLCNKGTITLTGEFKNHGGTVGCCGDIIASFVYLQENTSRPGSLGCINICNGTSTPPINIKDAPSSVGTTISDAYTYSITTTNGAIHASIDADSSGICGSNQGGGAVALPVDLIYFKATAKNKQNELVWATAMEENNSHFVVERSLNGENFEVIGEEHGNGNSQTIIEYTYFDTDIPNQTKPIYYRLKQVDYDGQFEYSDAVMVESKPTTNTEIFPNPTSDFIFVSKPGFRFNVSLTDQSGIPIEIKDDQVNTSQFSVSRIPNGFYIVQINSSQGAENFKVLVKH